MTRTLPRLHRSECKHSRRREYHRVSYLKESANFDGLHRPIIRDNFSGNGIPTHLSRVINATKKHTAAPIKHAPNPSNLYIPLAFNYMRIHLIFGVGTELTAPSSITRTMPPRHWTFRWTAAECNPPLQYCRTARMDFQLELEFAVAGIHL